MTGAVVGGPFGAAVGGVAGAVVGGAATGPGQPVVVQPAACASRTTTTTSSDTAPAGRRRPRTARLSRIRSVDQRMEPAVALCAFFQCDARSFGSDARTHQREADSLSAACYPHDQGDKLPVLFRSLRIKELVEAIEIKGVIVRGRAQRSAARACWQGKKQIRSGWTAAGLGRLSFHHQHGGNRWI